MTALQRTLRTEVTVVTAVIPAAGLGTRVREVAGEQPKEMLSVGGKPLIQVVVEEALAAGIRRIAVVVRPGKESIRECLMAKPGIGAELVFPVQPKPLGVVDALACARPFLGEKPFVMILPDQGLLAARSATAQLLAAWQPGPTIWSALVRIPSADIHCFPGARAVRLGRWINPVAREVHGFAKPGGENGRQAVRAIGRTVLPPAIFDHLGGSVDDLAAIYTRSGLPHHAIVLAGEPWDLGTVDGYRRFEPAVAAFHG